MITTLTLRWSRWKYLVLVIGLIVPSLHAAPQLISYQARLTDSSGIALPDSSYGVVLALYADSTTGTPLWSESAMVATQSGLFTHRLGSVTAFSRTLFTSNETLFLQVTVAGQAMLPRTRLSGVPYALTAGNLSVRDIAGTIAIQTIADSHQFSIYGPTGLEEIRLRGGESGDKAVVLPDSAISASETRDEPGIAYSSNSSLISLTTGSMTDLVTVDITIPSSGYILLHGKCYLLLSGTTGPNTALVQIDENPGGGSSYPYYTMAGLGGYVNTETNYFPVYVTRLYYRAAGSYTFRMEARASYPLPAEAKSWDHILTAVYYPTSYETDKGVDQSLIE
ncbi:MAG TPA: hypothetical protein VN285_06810 [Candidatus Deferrimicrobium sp.]|nr:hypothetical protein [Candidatus Deferrimicrobium sp.]